MDEFYRSEEGQNGRPAPWLLVADEDEGALIRPEAMRLAGVRTWASNQVDRVRSVVRGRQPVNRHSQVLELALPGPVRISNWHATAVVIREDCVDKLYFRAQEFHAALHRAVASYTGGRLVATGRVLCVRQPRLTPCPADRAPAEMFGLVDEAMAGLQATLLGSEVAGRPLSIEQKVAAIADAYGTAPGSGREALVAIGRELDRLVGKAGAWVCHGDFWTQNVMADAAGRPRLIDFDKCVQCTRVFDPLYYVLMTRGVGDPASLQEVLAPGHPAVAAARADIDAWLVRTGRPAADAAHYALALAAYVLLKAAEYECRHRKPGACLQWLQPLLVPITQVFPSAGAPLIP